MSQPQQLPTFSRSRPRSSDVALQYGDRLSKLEFQHSRSPSPRKSVTISDTLAMRMSLTAYRQHLLLQSWPQVQHAARSHGNDAFFKKLCDKSDMMKETFQKAFIVHGFTSPKPPDIYMEHSKLLFQLINDTLRSLSDKSCESIVERCREYGTKHAQLDCVTFMDSVWDELCESLVEEIIRTTVVRKHRGLSKAWTVLITFLMDHMKEGYNEAKRSRRQSSAICSMQKPQMKEVPAIDIQNEHSPSNKTEETI